MIKLLGPVEADDDRLTPLERETLSHWEGHRWVAAPGLRRWNSASSHASHSEAAAASKPSQPVGPITASVIVASIVDGKTFRNPRQFAAWLALFRDRTRREERYALVTPASADQRRQLHQLMTRVNHVDQSRAQQIILFRGTRAVLHG